MLFLDAASILVIENHPLMREALCDAISDEADLSVGMKAANGAVALQMLRVILPDIVLFAMANPGTDEMEALRTLRRSLPAVPILVLTSNEVMDQEQTALDSGACSVLTKAISRADLIYKLPELWTKEIMNHSDINSEREAKEKIST